MLRRGRLTGRGYRLESYENVLGLALDGREEHAAPPGIVVRPSGDDEFDQWLDVVADGVAHPDTQGVPWHEEFPRETYLRAERHMAAAGVRRYVALRDGDFAGGAGLRISESQQNAQRQGFDLLYTRAVLVKQP